MKNGEGIAMLPISAVVLAGGKSSRMGRDKALLPFGDYGSLSEYQYRRLGPIFDTVFISAKTDKFAFDAPIIMDIRQESSALVALLSCLQKVEGEALFLLGVDMPLVERSTMAALWDRYRTTYDRLDAVVATTSRGIEPLCGIYSTSLLPHIRTLLDANNHRIQDLLAHCKIQTVHFEDTAQFANLNTPDVYQKYC